MGSEPAMETSPLFLTQPRWETVLAPSHLYPRSALFSASTVHGPRASFPICSLRQLMKAGGDELETSHFSISGDKNVDMAIVVPTTSC